WIGEVRSRDLGHPLPGDPATDAVRRIDGYLVLNLLG
ncbi:MAG: DinB family protein, partial [Actinomycetota bacterium]|nr:DinB family protein [Actinomycetota bacterium]